MVFNNSAAGICTCNVVSPLSYYIGDKTKEPSIHLENKTNPNKNLDQKPRTQYLRWKKKI